MDDLFETIVDTLPRAPEDDIDRVEQRRSENPLEKTGLTLVKLGEALHTMTRADFEADMERGDLAAQVGGLIEFWPDDPENPAKRNPDAEHGGGVLRVAGANLSGEPQYFRADFTDGIFLSGRSFHDEWAVAHFDGEAIEGRDEQYLYEERLFDEEGQNRVAELERGAELVELIQSEGFQQLLDDLAELDEEEREAFLDEYFGRDADD